MSLKFGTSGLRGLSVDLKGKASAVYATAFARHLLTSGQTKAGDPILVGRDFRDSSPDVSATCIAALKKAGLTPLDCGTVPTPALALYGLSLKAGALMITGSHIPADRNGIKFYRPDGEIDKQDETAIAALAADAQVGEAAAGQVQQEDQGDEDDQQVQPAGAVHGPGQPLLHQRIEGRGRQARAGHQGQDQDEGETKDHAASLQRREGRAGCVTGPYGRHRPRIGAQASNADAAAT